MDSSNLFAVRMTKAGIVDDGNAVPMSRAEALNRAAWTVAMVSASGGCALREFTELYCAIVVNEQALKQDSAIAD